MNSSFHSQTHASVGRDIERIGAQVRYVTSLFQHGHMSVLIHFMVNWMITLEISDRQGQKVTIQDIFKILLTRIERLQHLYTELVFDYDHLTTESDSSQSTAAKDSTENANQITMTASLDTKTFDNKQTVSSVDIQSSVENVATATSTVPIQTNTTTQAAQDLLLTFRQKVYRLFSITQLFNIHVTLGSQLARISIVNTLLDTWTRQLVDSILFTDTETEFRQRLLDTLSERYSHLRLENGQPDTKAIRAEKQKLLDYMLVNI